MAQNHGVDILYTFGRTPTWASSNPNGYCANNANGSCYPPSSQQYWKDFVCRHAPLRRKDQVLGDLECRQSLGRDGSPDGNGEIVRERQQPGSFVLHVVRG